MVCPAEFDVGVDAHAMVYAVHEGEEQPLEQPVVFRATGLVVVDEVDEVDEVHPLRAAVATAGTG